MAWTSSYAQVDVAVVASDRFKASAKKLTKTLVLSRLRGACEGNVACLSIVDAFADFAPALESKDSKALYSAMVEFFRRYTLYVAVDAVGLEPPASPSTDACAQAKSRLNIKLARCLPDLFLGGKGCQGISVKSVAETCPAGDTAVRLTERTPRTFDGWIDLATDLNALMPAREQAPGAGIIMGFLKAWRQQNDPSYQALAEAFVAHCDDYLTNSLNGLLFQKGAPFQGCLPAEFTTAADAIREQLATGRRLTEAQHKTLASVMAFEAPACGLKKAMDLAANDLRGLDHILRWRDALPLLGLVLDFLGEPSEAAFVERAKPLVVRWALDRVKRAVLAGRPELGFACRSGRCPVPLWQTVDGATLDGLRALECGRKLWPESATLTCENKGPVSSLNALLAALEETKCEMTTGQETVVITKETFAAAGGLRWHQVQAAPLGASKWALACVSDEVMPQWLPTTKAFSAISTLEHSCGFVGAQLLTGRTVSLPGGVCRRMLVPQGDLPVELFEPVGAVGGRLKPGAVADLGGGRYQLRDVTDTRVRLALTLVAKVAGRAQKRVAPDATLEFERAIADVQRALAHPEPMVALRAIVRTQLLRLGRELLAHADAEARKRADYQSVFAALTRAAIEPLLDTIGAADAQPSAAVERGLKAALKDEYLNRSALLVRVGLGSTFTQVDGERLVSLTVLDQWGIAKKWGGKRRWYLGAFVGGFVDSLIRTQVDGDDALYWLMGGTVGLTQFDESFPVGLQIHAGTAAPYDLSNRWGFAAGLSVLVPADIVFDD